MYIQLCKFGLTYFYIGYLVHGYPYIELTAPSRIRYQQDDAIFNCTPVGVASSASISDIILYEKSSTGGTEIVKVYADTSNGSLMQTTVWSNNDFQQRSTTIKASVSPTSQATLQIKINATQLLCSDAGMYWCMINGNMDMGEKLNSQSTPRLVSIADGTNTCNASTENTAGKEHIATDGIEAFTVSTRIPYTNTAPGRELATTTGIAMLFATLSVTIIVMNH